jgi:hypothetical protein
MKHRPSHSPLPLIFALLAALPVASPARTAQGSDRPRAKPEQEALKLLDEALDEARALKLPENRLWVQGLAVAALWRHDERPARALLAALTGELKRLAAETQSDANRRQHFARGQLRHDVARMLMPRDAALARDFLNATRPPADPRNEYSEPYLTRLAPGQVARGDARQLEQAARASLAGGYHYEFWTLFERLRKVDRGAAGRLSARLLEKLRADASFAKPDEGRDARYFALRLLELDAKGARAAAGLGRTNAAPTPPLADAARGELLALLAHAALAAAPLVYSANQQEQSAARGLLSSLHAYQPELKKLLPALEAKLRQPTAELRRTLNATQRERLELSHLMANGSLAELIEAARQSRTSARESFYEVITSRLVAEGGDLQAVRQLINEHAEAPERRQVLLDRVVPQAVHELSEAGRFDEALKLIDEAGAGEQSLDLLLSVAVKLAEDGDAEAALRLLERAESALALPVESPRQASAVAALMRAYARAAPARNFAWLEGLSGQLDALVRALVTLGELEDYYAYSHAAEGELLLRGSNLFHHPVGVYLKHLAPLARVDFERARQLAEGFTQAEVRALARVYVASGVLIEPELRDEP